VTEERVHQTFRKPGDELVREHATEDENQDNNEKQ